MKKSTKHEPIIYTGQGDYDNFLNVVEGIGYKYLIYAQDAEGGNKSVWATNEKELTECLLLLSEKYLFGRVQLAVEGIKYGFEGKPHNEIANA